MSSSAAVWRLRAGADRRFRAGHPWVYSNELAESPKGLDPGAPIELQDASGKFLARGYGNPASLISFRALSRDPAEADPLSNEGILRRLASARQLREALGLGEVSYRLCFGESDGLPGLIVDRFMLGKGPEGQVLVVQAHTAGMNRLVPRLAEILQAHVAAAGGKWDRTAVVLRNDVGVRKLEGLAEEEPRVLRDIPGVSLSDVRIQVAPATPGDPIEFCVDLIGGQKTGFFLDQVANIQLAALRLPRPVAGRPVRILDLCCYVGQWSSQLARHFRRLGHEVEVTAVDASAKALELARRNIELQGARCETLKGDVLRDLPSLVSESFDVVISDPPALIQGRKDIPQGTHAYLQLHTQALRLVSASGSVVCCSCSALLDEEEFVRTLAKAAQRNRRNVRWVGRGAQSPDHPVLAEFPEGRYLKVWIGVVS